MNRVKFLVGAALAVVAFSGIGCNNDSGGSRAVDNDKGTSSYAAHAAPAQTLKENTWKLKSIVDVKTDSLTELEPKDCEECYTLTFDTDTTFSSFSSVNSGSGTYNYDKHSFSITEFSATDMVERGDGQRWANILWTVDAFSLLENDLRLYYNEYKNYLLFVTK